MTAAIWSALAAALGLVVAPGLTLIGALAFVLSQLDRRRDVRRFYRMRRA